MLVASHVVVVKIDQGLDGLLHCRHLDQSHFTIPGRRTQGVSTTEVGYRLVSSHHQGLVYVLEKLERLHSASSVGEEQPQVILRHVLSITTNTVVLWDAH